MQSNNKITLPNILTLVRLLLSPIMLPFLIVFLLPLNVVSINIVLTVLFCAFGITDFFDGFLARRYGQVSPFGRFLDPIADKFLVFSTIVALLAVGKISFVIVLLFIGREFFVLSLRQLALENNFSVNVSYWGKLKTVFQLAYIAVLILNPYHKLGSSYLSFSLTEWYAQPVWFLTETFLMVVAIIFTVRSAQDYYRSFKISYCKIQKS